MLPSKAGINFIALPTRYASNAHGVWRGYRKYRAYGLYTTTAGKLILELDQSTAAQDVKIEAPFIPVLERWYHIAFTFSDSTNQVSLYVDGERVASTTTQQSLIYGATNLVLGATSNVRPRVSIDNFRMWNVSRSHEEIQEGMTRQYAQSTNIVLDLRFEDHGTQDVLITRSIRITGFVSAIFLHWLSLDWRSRVSIPL